MVFLDSLLYYHSLVEMGFAGYLYFAADVDFPVVSSYVKMPREVLICRNWASVLFCLGFVTYRAATSWDLEAKKELATVATGCWAMIAAANLNSLKKFKGEKHARDAFYCSGDLGLFTVMTFAYGAAVLLA
mmetsp:Transcript_38375/g.75056  ORF Transcript_38375/g.75056 Transcript_38375/m.75056 type:complete len:131 (+) Transcript_38375:176-568(+)